MAITIEDLEAACLPPEAILAAVKVAWAREKREQEEARDRQLAKLAAQKREQNKNRLPLREWLLVCEEVFQRDGEVCRYCSATERLSVDHIVPVCRGGSNDLANLCVACIPCNSSKSGRLLSEWTGRR